MNEKGINESFESYYDRIYGVDNKILESRRSGLEISNRRYEELRGIRTIRTIPGYERFKTQIGLVDDLVVDNSKGDNLADLLIALPRKDSTITRLIFFNK